MSYPGTGRTVDSTGAAQKSQTVRAKLKAESGGSCGDGQRHRTKALPKTAIQSAQEGRGSAMKPRSRKPVVMTIGHSNRTLEEFLQLLRAHGVERVVDVRTVPRSRHNPQFNRATLPARLRAQGIG